MCCKMDKGSPETGDEHMAMAVVCPVFYQGKIACSYWSLLFYYLAHSAILPLAEAGDKATKDYDKATKDYPFYFSSR